MNHLKCNMLSFKGTRRFVKIITAQLPNPPRRMADRTSILLFFTSYFLFLTSHLSYAGGMVYWTPNGVLLNNFNAGAWGAVDDIKGGAIVLSASSPSPTVFFIHALRVDRNGNLPWGLQGKTVDSADIYQDPPLGVSDEKCGAILVWPRGANPWSWLCYQRIDSLGSKVWGDTARRIVVIDSQITPVAVADGNGGMIVAWQQRRSGQYDIYAQRIDSMGVRRWGDYGVAVCTADSNQESPIITCDNYGNSVIAWTDLRSGGYDVYSQRLNSDGSALWLINGIVICDTIGSQGPTGVVVNTDTTIVIVWNDGRKGFANRDIYAQSLRLSGAPMWAIQGLPVCDTINRQGGANYCRW